MLQAVDPRPVVNLWEKSNLKSGLILQFLDNEDFAFWRRRFHDSDDTRFISHRRLQTEIFTKVCRAHLLTPLTSAAHYNIRSFKKYLDQRQVSLSFTLGQKYAPVGSWPNYSNFEESCVRTLRLLRWLSSKALILKMSHYKSRWSPESWKCHLVSYH